MPYGAAGAIQAEREKGKEKELGSSLSAVRGRRPSSVAIDEDCKFMIMLRRCLALPFDDSRACSGDDERMGRERCM